MEGGRECVWLLVQRTAFCLLGRADCVMPSSCRRRKILENAVPVIPGRRRRKREKEKTRRYGWDGEFDRPSVHRSHDIPLVRIVCMCVKRLTYDDDDDMVLVVGILS